MYQYHACTQTRRLRAKLPCKREERNMIYLYSGLYQVQAESQSLPHEHVRVMALIKSLL